MPKKKLTASFCSLVPFFEPVPHPDRPNKFRKVQEIYWDKALRGFGFCIGATTKSFIIQWDIHGRTRRKTIGKYPHLTIEQARRQAKRQISEMILGKDPSEEMRLKIATSLTLAEAADLKRRQLVTMQRSDRTILDHDYAFKKYFPKWANKEMKEIGEDRKGLRQFHEKLTRDHGPITANHTVGWLRGVYNRARKEHPDLPPNPAENIDWNPTKRGGPSIPMKDLPGIWAGIQKLNSLKRDFYILLLFTGLRRQSAYMVRWEHFNEEEALLHIPRPKGGEERAFNVPLTNPLLEVFRSRREENEIIVPDGSPWVFPSIMSGSGHIVEPKLTAIERESFPIQVTPHMFRRTYTSAGNAVGVNEYNLALLLNHSLSSINITGRYVHGVMESLRADQEAITNYLLTQMNHVKKGK